MAALKRFDFENEQIPVLPFAAFMLLLILTQVFELGRNYIGLTDFYGLAAFAEAFATKGVWPGTSYFPAGYPLLLALFGKLGDVLLGGYILSALGLLIAMLAAMYLAKAFGLRNCLWLIAVGVMALQIPAVRLLASSPSVDALYTAIGLWFLFSAVKLWRERRQSFLRDTAYWPTILGMMLPAIVLPLLRYHAVVLLIPVLAVLMLWRPVHRKLASYALIWTLLAVGFNYASYAAAFGEPIPSVATLQMRVGLEMDQPTHYASTDELFANYGQFAAHARSSSVVADYGLGRIVAHTLNGWWHFLRRPTIVLTALLCVVLWWRRIPIPVGVVMLLLWTAGYTLALSVAYYTPRASAPPELALLPCVLVLVRLLVTQRTQYWALGVAALGLMGAFAFSGSFVDSILRENERFDAIGEELMNEFDAAQLNRRQIYVSDMRITAKESFSMSNPWCRPYRYSGDTWLVDTQPGQVPWLEDLRIELEDVPRECELAIVDPATAEKLKETTGVEPVRETEVEGMLVLEY